MDRYEDSLATVNQGLAIKADDPYLLRVQSIALAGLGRREEAMLVAASFMDSDPDDLSAQLCAGRLYSLTRDYGRAEERFRHALHLDPNSTSALLGLGLLYTEQRRLAEAKPLLEETLRLNPHSRRARAALNGLVN